MHPIFKNLFKIGKRNRDWTDSIKLISRLSDEINSKTEKLHDVQFNMMLDKKDEMFISLADFVELMSVDSLSVADILKKCRHVKEISSIACSSVEAYPIIENDHVVLCPGDCDRHKSYKGSKLKIVSIK